MTRYRFKPATTMLLLALAISACTTEQVPVDNDELIDKLVTLGIGYIRNGQLSRTMEHLDRAHEIAPSSAQVHNTLGLAFQVEQDAVTAEQYFEKALRYSNGDTRIRNNYAAFLFGEERYREAIEKLQFAAENQFYEGRAIVFENLGVSHLKIGELTIAEESFLKRLALKSALVRSLLELAEIRTDQQNCVVARDLYQRYHTVGEHSAQSLWICVRPARVFEEEDEEARCGLMFCNVFPAALASQEYADSLSSSG
ncbi:MAG: type IV pilus biogenesis/stability protein PilW [OM182 bacterium MED-G24]|uniref:Type IV pilus biogenesis/stability protein PilW n=1 Tax=OM182 bacterium MED-G24 TaxID=1986255 RepID=A0A2A5WST3_9GAMM|nr:MAG: type IV pilus biogenesis/stability protein PilW [OM182 bacterium MED-G24]